jgi:ABC-type transporter Mla subunit MlaD
VTVGKVVERRREGRGNATLATIQLENEYAPLRSDARAMLRLKTLLGETYVELTGGTRGARYLPEGGRLPNGNVADQVDFDELLRTFDKPTRRALQRWQATLARATEGRGKDFSNAIGSLPGFVESTDRFVELLNRRRETVAQLVRNGGITFEALTRNGTALQTLITRNRQVFDELASEREALAESIQILPTFQIESRATMRRLSRFAVRTEPLIRELQPALRDAVPTLASLRRLSPDLRRLFRDLDPLIVAGRTGFPALARVLRGLDPTLAAFGPFLEQLNPFLEYLEYSQTQLSDFISVGPAALQIKLPGGGADSLGHALPQIIVTGSQSIPATERTADNRGNAYLRPNALTFDRYKRDGFLILPTWDCGNTSTGGEKRPGPENDPGCFVQEPLRFQGRLQRFPQVGLAASGGRTPGRGDVPETTP